LKLTAALVAQLVEERVGGREGLATSSGKLILLRPPGILYRLKQLLLLYMGSVGAPGRTPLYSWLLLHPAQLVQE
jgi:hypothetical protein